MKNKHGGVDLDEVARLYSKSIQEHGATSVGVGWPNPAQHRLRFEKLTYLIDAHDAGFTVNDLGCGYGALYEYLKEEGYSILRYRGHDISREMLLEAEQRLLHHGNVELSDSPRLDAASDYSFASGIFNVRFEQEEADWVEYIKSTLDNLYECSRKGFAFNLLSTYVDYRREHLYYGDPRFFFDYCKRRYSPFVALLHDYPLYEWTMIVRKS